MPAFVDFADTYQTQSAASRLAEVIRLYWAAHGSAVEMRIEKARSGFLNIYVVRSDMIGGKPRVMGHAPRS